MNRSGDIRAEAREALEIVQSAYARARASDGVVLPIIAYFDAGRAWLPHKERHKTKAVTNGAARRWGAFQTAASAGSSPLRRRDRATLV